VSLEDRRAIISATLTLFDEVPPAAPAGGGAPSTGGAGSSSGTASTIRAFFDLKQPASKLEELAVAARYMEQKGSTRAKKNDFKAAFKDAKRPFDDRHFSRDIGNAKTAKLFNTGIDNQLSYYGEHYVDALPDRVKALAIARPGKGKKTRPSKKA
jgi:hypothetical protein